MKRHGGKPIAEDNLPEVCGQNESLLKEEETPGHAPQLYDPPPVGHGRQSVENRNRCACVYLFIFSSLADIAHLAAGCLGLDTQGVSVEA